MVLGVPIHKHFRVVCIKHHLCYEQSIGGLSLVVAISGPFGCLVFHVLTRKSCPKNVEFHLTVSRNKFIQKMVYDSMCIYKSYFF